MDPNHPSWASPVEAPLVLEEPSARQWDDAADLVVVGFGGAGVAAALEAAEHGVSVLALDRYEGGGSSAANGGVFYAGGGTKHPARGRCRGHCRGDVQVPEPRDPGCRLGADAARLLR